MVCKKQLFIIDPRRAALSRGYPTVRNLKRLHARERERGREREKRRGTTTDPGRERRQKEKNMITCCSGLRRYRKSGVLRAKNKKKRKEPGPAPRREGGEEGQGGRERAKKLRKKSKERENFSHAAFGQQKWGISGPEKPPRKNSGQPIQKTQKHKT